MIADFGTSGRSLISGVVPFTSLPNWSFSMEHLCILASRGSGRQGVDWNGFLPLAMEPVKHSVCKLALLLHTNGAVSKLR